MKAEKRAESAESLCDNMRNQLKESQSEVSALKMQVAKCETTIQDRDVAIENLKSDLSRKSM